MPAWIDAGFEEYARRMPRASEMLIKEIKPAPRTNGATADQWRDDEAKRIALALPQRCCKVVLDERGKPCATTALAQHIEAWKQQGRDIAFIIGGADGLSDVIKQQADLLMSLSAMTLPHGLCRIIIAEQLYRAVSLTDNHPYHRP